MGSGSASPSSRSDLHRGWTYTWFRSIESPGDEAKFRCWCNQSGTLLSVVASPSNKTGLKRQDQLADELTLTTRIRIRKPCDKCLGRPNASASPAAEPARLLPPTTAFAGAQFLKNRAVEGRVQAATGRDETTPFCRNQLEPENCLKTRWLPPVGCTLCWAAPVRRDSGLAGSPGLGGQYLAFYAWCRIAGCGCFLLEHLSLQRQR